MLKFIIYGAKEIKLMYGYYDGGQSVNVVRKGFELVYSIIEKIKPS